MNLREHLLQQLLETLVLSPLVELADEMAPYLERVGGESQGGVAEVLFIRFVSAIWKLVEFAQEFGQGEMSQE